MKATMKTQIVFGLLALALVSQDASARVNGKACYAAYKEQLREKYLFKYSPCDISTNTFSIFFWTVALEPFLPAFVWPAPGFLFAEAAADLGSATQNAVSFLASRGQKHKYGDTFKLLSAMYQLEKELEVVSPTLEEIAATSTFTYLVNSDITYSALAQVLAIDSEQAPAFVAALFKEYQSGSLFCGFGSNAILKPSKELVRELKGLSPGR